MPDQPQADQRQEKGGLRAHTGNAPTGWIIAPVLAGAVFVGGFAMAEKLTDEQVRAFFDQHYPFIEQNEEPPGHVVANDDGRPGQRWSGQSGWRTRHGTSIVRWRLGRPVFASGADLADGTRVDVQNVGNWRYQISDNPRCWVHGTVDIRPDGVTFTPGEQSKYIAPAPSGHPDLAVDLKGDDEVRERLIGADFADTLYGYLKNGEFFKEGGDWIWSTGMASAAGIVANLRGQGDVYTDYFPHGGREPLPPFARRRLTPEQAAFEAALSDRFLEIEAIVTRLSWRRVKEEDRQIDAATTRRDLALWEERPQGVAPAWAAKMHAPRPRSPGAIRLLKNRREPTTEAERTRFDEIENQTLEIRLYSLATSGRITEAEYRSMVIRIARIP
jgi:hypothetical protein